MQINFNYQGSTYKAGLAKQGSNRIVVLFDHNGLEQKFGPALPFHVEGKKVEFDILNRSHSDLYALNSSISKAISEQCEEIL